MKFLMIVVFLMTCSCTQELKNWSYNNNKVDAEINMWHQNIVIKYENGQTDKIKFQKESNTSTKTPVKVYERLVKDASCEHPGVCYKCGFTMGGEYECSMSFWRNCPGTREELRKYTLYDIVDKKTYSTQRGNVEFVRDTYQRQEYRIIKAGNCG